MVLLLPASSTTKESRCQFQLFYFMLFCTTLKVSAGISSKYDPTYIQQFTNANIIGESHSYYHLIKNPTSPCFYKKGVSCLINRSLWDCFKVGPFRSSVTSSRSKIFSTSLPPPSQRCFHAPQADTPQSRSPSPSICYLRARRPLPGAFTSQFLGSIYIYIYYIIILHIYAIFIQIHLYL